MEREALTETDTRFATPADLDRIAAWDRSAFEAADLVPARQLRTWYEANPTSFRIAERGGLPTGYLGLLWLSRETLDAFVAGKVRERDFGAADILAPDLARGSARLLLFTLLVLPQFRLRGRTAHRLLADTARWLDEVIQAQRITIFATGATSAGRALLDHARFALVRSAESRQDGHALYARDFVVGSVREAYQSAISRFRG